MPPGGTARAMLRKGGDPLTVAQVTHLPQALVELMPALAPEVLLGEPGRPHAGEFFGLAARRWEIETLADRVYRLTRRTRAGRPAQPGG